MHVSTIVQRLILGAGLVIAALAPAAIGGLVADAQSALPTLTPLHVQASGTEATVAFTSSEPVAVTHTYQPAAPTADRPMVQAWNIYTTSHQTTLTGLTSNTKYQVSVAAETRDGRHTNGSASFYTAKKRVRLVLESIDIKDDGDVLLTGDGEPVWFASLAWPGREREFVECYPISTPKCEKTGEYGECRFSPSNSNGDSLMLVFAEENFDRFPDALTLLADAYEDDNFWARFVTAP
jgi:hypothetical protein